MNAETPNQSRLNAVEPHDFQSWEDVSVLAKVLADTK